VADIPVRLLLSAIGGASVTSIIGQVTSSLGKGGLSGVLLGVGAAAAGLAIGFGVQAVQAFSQYQQAMVQLQNTTNSSNVDMKQYEATIQSLSNTTGKSQTDLASGMYQIISANFSGADATRILTTATQASIIANANQTQVTTGLVVTLNAFGLKASQVDTISNQMFKTLSLGRGQMGDLAGALQTGGALVAHYGVSVTDMDAILATLSTGGMKTFGTSMTGLTQLLNVMDGKTDLITKRIHALGLPFDETKFKAMSVQQQIAYLNATLANNKGQEVSILGSKQAATALGILGTQSDLLKSNTLKLKDAQELATEKQQAWTRVQQTAAFQGQLFQTQIQNLMITLGANLLPIINNIIGWLGQFGGKVVTITGNVIDWINKSNIIPNALNAVHDAVNNVQHVVSGTINVVQNIVGWFQKWHTPILAVAGAITAFFLPAIIKAGVEAAISGGKIAGSFIANLAKTGAEAVVNGIKLTTSFIGSMIKAGVEAVVNGAKITAQFVASIIKAGIEGWQAAGKLAVMIGQFIASGVQAALAGAKMAAQFVAQVVKAGLSAIVTAGQFVGSLIPAILSMVADAIVAAATAIPGLITAFVGATVAAWGFTAALLANPITWIVLAIVGLIAVIILLATHWGQVVSFLKGAWHAFSTWFMNALHAVGSFFSSLWSHIVEFFRQHIALIIAIVTGPLGALVVLIVTHWRQITQFFQNLWKKVVDVFTNVKNDIGKAINNLWQSMVSIVTTWPGKALQWGANLIQGFIQGIKNALGNLGQTLGNVGGTIKNFLGFHSPTKMGPGQELDQWPQALIKSYGAGLVKALPQLQSSLNLVMRPVASTLSGQNSAVAPSSISASRSALGGGSIVVHHQPVYNINVSTMAGSPAEVRRMTNLIQQEMARQFRSTTPGYNSGLVF